jgi:hypothetical protein
MPGRAVLCHVLHGRAEGLRNPSLAAESLRHFASLGHRQVLAGYYDGPVGAIRGWLRDGREILEISGAMYTTWRHQYRDLEAFAAQLDRHGAARP